MDFTNIKSIVIPEGKAIQIEVDGIIVWKSGPKNWVKYSTTEDGVTIYNEGKGYKEGWRVSSTGPEKVHDGGVCTGYIPVKAGDIIRLSGWTVMAMNGGNAINVYNNAFTNLGQAAGNWQDGGYGIIIDTYRDHAYQSITEETPGVYRWIVPPSDDIVYIRVSAYTDNGSKMIVTVNEEFTIQGQD